MAVLATPEFWLALSQIILINIVLSGDNAVVIALACRSLPPQRYAMAWNDRFVAKIPVGFMIQIKAIGLPNAMALADGGHCRAPSI